MGISGTNNGEVSGGSLLRRLESEFLRPHRRWIAFGLVGLLIQSGLLLPIPLLQGWVLDQLVPLVSRVTGNSRGQTTHAAGIILLALGTTIVCLLLRMAVAWRVATMIGRISHEVVLELRATLHRKLFRLPMAYFDAQQTGRLMAKLTSDVGSLLSFMSSGSLQLVNDLLLAIGIAAVLIWLQWRLALIALIAVPLYGFNHRVFCSKSHRLSVLIRAQIASICALLSERMSAVRVVRSFAQEPAELAEFDRRIDAHRDSSWTHARSNAFHSALAALISGLGTVGVLTCGALLVERGRLTVGELLAFFALVGQLYNPIVRLTQFQITLAATHASLERIFELLDEPESIVDHASARSIQRSRGALTFDSVTFRFAANGPNVLENINLRVEPGMTLGVLGPSGSGKTTLLSLAPRLYEVPDGNGAVRLDGEDVRGFRMSDLRRAIMLVSQRAVLFGGTVRSNLLYAAPNATEDQILGVLRVTDLAETLRSFPMGLDTPVGERGQTLSGGQRQRLALARAILADPAVLLLDDCTSALDAETEAKVRSLLFAFRAGRTCLIATHKIASVRHADLIVVLSAGKIIEQGTHAELLGNDGYYAATYERQARVYLSTPEPPAETVSPEAKRESSSESRWKSRRS